MASVNSKKFPAATKGRKRQTRPGGVKGSYALADAKAHLSEIIDHVEVTGEEVVVTRHGKPVVRLVPNQGEGPRLLGFASGRIKRHPGWDKPLLFVGC